MSIDNHTKFMQRCIELAQLSVIEGDLPFGALIVKEKKIVIESGQTVVSSRDATGHAEVNVLRKAQQLLGNDLSSCALYSNCEPCAMCSFLINELLVGEVVFAVKSPDMGGYTRWDILNDKNAERLAKLGVKFPKVTPYFMEEEASNTFINFERQLLGLPWKG